MNIIKKEHLENLLINGKTRLEISKIYSCSIRTVSNYIKKYNLKGISTFSKEGIKYNDPFMFNKIDSPEKAYIIGYALADGYINEKTLVFCCSRKDEEILNFIEKNMGSKVHHYEQLDKRTNKKYFNSKIYFYNKNLVTDFNKHCSSKENKHVPIIPKHLKRYLLLGFFDGDGCLTFGKRKDRDRIWFNVNFSSQLKVLEGIQKILFEECEIPTSIRPKTTENCFVLEFSNKKSVLKFLDFIYPNDNFIVLNRKYNKANALRLLIG